MPLMLSKAQGVARTGLQGVQQFPHVFMSHARRNPQILSGVNRSFLGSEIL